jgi:hypothetical protein
MKFPALVVFSLALLAKPVMAKDIIVYPTSPLAGPAGSIINGLSTFTKPLGYSIRPRQLGTCGEAVQRFNESKNPVAIIMSNHQYRNARITKQDCVIDDFTNITVLFVANISNGLCVKKDKKLPSNSLATLGIAQFVPIKSVAFELSNNKSGISFKPVIFQGSNNILQGLISGDIDAGFIALNNAGPAIEAGSIECLYSTNSSRFNQKPMIEFTGRESFVNHYGLSFMFLLKNIDQDKIQELVTAIKHLPENFKNYYIDSTVISPDKKTLDQIMSRALMVKDLD